MEHGRYEPDDGGSRLTGRRSALLFGLVKDRRGTTSDGASIVPFHNSAYYRVDERRAVPVPTFSFTRLLREKHDHYNLIVAKLDIEGAEYEVLSDMIEQGMGSCLECVP